MDEWITEYLHNKVLYCSGSEPLYVTMGKFHNPWAKKKTRQERIKFHVLNRMWARWIIPLNHRDCHAELKNKTQIYVVYKKHFLKWKRNVENQGMSKEMSSKCKQNESRDDNINIRWGRT